jgi:hypothetical protein
MMNRRENMLAFLNHEPHDHIPAVFPDICMTGGDLESFENGTMDDPFDGYGVKWVRTTSGAGQGTPDHSHIVLEDICDWEDVVRFPDLDAYDWEGQAAAQLANFDPVNQVQEYSMWNGQFLRLMHLMGFQEGLISLVAEPEAAEALLTAITDHRIKSIDYVRKYFNPDTICLYDDFASKNNLFLSPETYRDLIKPQHKRFFDAVRDAGIIPNMHVCGKPEEVVPDFIDEGIAAWEVCQPENDLVKLGETLGDKLAFLGGFDSQGPLAVDGFTEEELREETRRTIDAYAANPNYGFFGFIMTDDPMVFVNSMTIMGDEAVRYGTDYYLR